MNVTIAGFVLDRKNKAFPKESVLVGTAKGAAEVGQIKWERAVFQARRAPSVKGLRLNMKRPRGDKQKRKTGWAKICKTLNAKPSHSFLDHVSSLRLGLNQT